jgi:hypothetical protein
MMIPIILAGIVVALAASYVFERQRRRRHGGRLAAQADRARGLDGNAEIIAGEGRAMEGGAGRTG